jgi:hypothetical protein
MDLEKAASFSVRASSSSSTALLGDAMDHTSSIFRRPYFAGMALVFAIAAACSQSPKRDVEQLPRRDTPIGTILRLHAVQRSLEACRANAISESQCRKALETDQRHLDSVNARIEALLQDPRTNMCDVVRWTGSCNNPSYNLGDLADCLQVVPDRIEALNSGRFPLKVDSAGCPTDTK